MSLPKPNPVEPPWYGPVCPVVGEGWYREVSPYPDLGPDSGPRVAVYEYALAVAGSATPRRPVPMNSTISAAAIHKRPASMKASK